MWMPRASAKQQTNQGGSNGVEQVGQIKVQEGQKALNRLRRNHRHYHLRYLFDHDRLLK